MSDHMVDSVNFDARIQEVNPRQSAILYSTPFAHGYDIAQFFTKRNQCCNLKRNNHGGTYMTMCVPMLKHSVMLWVLVE